jgi:fructose-1,6-bisphosphatase/inositol monophosphatase family enzyme
LQVTVEFMRRIAEAAATETLPRFRRQSEVSNKLSGGFDPVTEADRGAERAIRALINAEFPDTAFWARNMAAKTLPAAMSGWWTRSTAPAPIFPACPYGARSSA